MAHDYDRCSWPVGNCSMADEIARLRAKCAAQKAAFISYTQWDESPLPVEFQDTPKEGME